MAGCSDITTDLEVPDVTGKDEKIDDLLIKQISNLRIKNKKLKQTESCIIAQVNQLKNVIHNPDQHLEHNSIDQAPLEKVEVKGKRVRNTTPLIEVDDPRPCKIQVEMSDPPLSSYSLKELLNILREESEKKSAFQKKIEENNQFIMELQKQYAELLQKKEALLKMKLS